MFPTTYVRALRTTPSNRTFESIILNCFFRPVEAASRMQSTHSCQLFHIGGERLQGSSRGTTTNAAVHVNIKKTNPLLRICASGVLATRQVLPGTLIDRIWVKLEAPIRLRHGKTIMSRRWVTYADRRVEKLRITGWVGRGAPTSSKLP